MGEAKNIYEMVLHLKLLNNTLLEWFIFIAISIVVYSALLRLKKRAAESLDSESQKSELKSLTLSLISSIGVLPLFIFSVLLASLWLNLPVATKSILSKLLVITFLFQMAIWSGIIVNFIIEIYVRKRLGKESSEAGRLFGPIKFVLLLVLWSLILLMALDNLGVNITAFITGLGIGGIAVALAVQNILGDLFSSLSIVLDKPFEVGDFVVIDNISGNVEQVGVKSTRIKSISGEQIIISNSDLLKSRIKNYKRMGERRILFRLGVVYELSSEQLRMIPEIIKRCIERNPNVRFDRAHFAGFGAYSLDFEAVYFVLSSDYREYMDIQQNINLSIFEEFKANKISFAYPTQVEIRYDSKQR